MIGAEHALGQRNSRKAPANEMSALPNSLREAESKFEQAYDSPGIVGALAIDAKQRCRSDVIAIQTMLVQNFDKIPILKRVNKACLDILPRVFGLVRLERGRCLFQQGDLGDKLFCVLAG